MRRPVALHRTATVDNHGTVTIGDNAQWINNGGTNSIHNETDGTITGNGTSTPGTINVPLDNDGTVTSTSGTLNVGGTQPAGIVRDRQLHRGGRRHGRAPEPRALRHPDARRATGRWDRHDQLSHQQRRLGRHGPEWSDVGLGRGWDDQWSGCVDGRCGWDVADADADLLQLSVPERHDRQPRHHQLRRHVRHRPVATSSNGTVDNHGTVTIGDNAQWINNGGTNSIHNETDGTITGNGTSTPGTINVPLDNDGTVTSTSGTLNVGGTQPAGIVRDRQLHRSGRRHVALQNLELFGTPTLGAPPGGGTVTISSVTNNAGSGATVPNGRTLDWVEGGTISGPGALTVAAGGTLRMPTQTCFNHRFLNGTIVNRGTIDYADTCGIGQLLLHRTAPSTTTAPSASATTPRWIQQRRHQLDPQRNRRHHHRQRRTPGTLNVPLDNDGTVTSTQPARRSRLTASTSPGGAGTLGAVAWWDARDLDRSASTPGRLRRCRTVGRWIGIRVGRSVVRVR